MLTSRHPGQQPRRLYLAAACAALLLVALFTVPYHVPVSRSFSDSYVFGYSNRAGVVIVGLLALLAAAFLPPPRPFPSASKRTLTRSTLAKALALTAALGTLLVVLTYRLDGFNESVYTVDRTRLLLEGHTPYRDFEFCYGLLALYGPAFLTRALHLSVPASCDIFFLVACLLGVWQLYVIISWSEFRADHQRVVFLVLFLLFLPAIFATTTAYTLPRFLTGGLLAMVSQRLLVRGTQRDHLFALLLPIPAVALTVLLSPEMGLAYAAGIALYLLRFGRLNRALYLAAYLTTLAGMAGILLLARYLGAFVTLSAFGGGAFSFPIVPAPHILLFLVALAVAAAYLTSRLRTGENTPHLALGFMAPAMLPAALGRCDSAHVMFDGIIVLIIALLVCSSSSRIPRLLIPAVVFVFLLLPFVRGLRGFVSSMTLLTLPYALDTHDASSPQNAWVEHLTLRMWGPIKGPINFDRMRNRQTADQTLDVPTAFNLPASTVFAAPFGFSGNHTGTYHAPSIDYGYFLSVVDMVTPQEVARKIAELDRHPERPLLVPAGAEASCLVYPANARAEIEALFAYPYSAPAAHSGDITEPLCAFIRTEYHIAQPATAAHYGTALWVRNPLPAR